MRSDAAQTPGLEAGTAARRDPAPPRGEPDPDHASASEAVRRRPLILMADDEELVRDLAYENFEEAGFDIAQAANGKEAVEAYPRLQPDVVLLDLRMPEMDGLTACAALRRLPAASETPIVIVTGDADQDTVQRAYDAGATDFVTKPLNWLILGKRLAYLASRSRSERWPFSRAHVERVACLGTWEWDASTRRTSWSEETRRILGTNGRAPGIRSFLRLTHPEDRQHVFQELTRCIRGGELLEISHRVLGADGAAVRHVRHWGEPQWDSSGRLVAFRGIVQDVTDLKNAEERIWRLSHVDELTGLPNRATFEQRLGQELAAGRDRGCVAVVRLDVDRFREINESFGQATGDALLKRVAEGLRNCGQAGDAVARLEGDEFAVTLAVSSVEQATQRAQTLLDLLSKEWTIDQHEVFLSVSAGIAVSPYDGEEPEALLHHSEIALRRAQAAGRGSLRLYETSKSGEGVSRKLTLERLLRRALEVNELSLHYQPLVDGRSATLVGVEALLRWNSPVLGPVSPAEFVPVAEELGLIVPIGKWALKAAVRQLRAWLDSGLDPGRMSVNLAKQQLVEGDFAAAVASVLEETAIPGSRLQIELTEGGLFSKDPNTTAQLAKLNAMGVGLAIDDFGTGLSALGYLRNFQIDSLKIDRSFVSGIPGNRDDAQLVAAIIAMAHQLRLQVVAEGVETEDQISFLRDNGCDEAQGYFFSKPLSPEQLTAYLATRSAAATARES